MGILDILLGGARGGQGSGQSGGGFSKIAMAMIALMLWQWYKSRSAGGGAEAPEPESAPSPRGQARIPDDAPARMPQSAPAQIPSPGSGGDSDSDFGPLANPKNMQVPGGGGRRGRQMDDEEEGMDGPGGGGGGSLGDILNDILRGGRGGGMPMPGDDEEMDDPRQRMPRGGRRGRPMDDEIDDPRGRFPRGGRGGDGGLGDILGEILGGGRGMPGQRVAGSSQSDPLSDVLLSAGIGSLGGLLAGGASGGVLGGLLQQFDQAGRGDAARSWVSKGDNVPVTPKDVENTFGPDIIDQIAQQFGMDRNELLKGLSQMLPQVVDQLTPDGRLPTEQELSRRG